MNREAREIHTQLFSTKIHTELFSTTSRDALCDTFFLKKAGTPLNVRYDSSTKSTTSKILGFNTLRTTLVFFSSLGTKLSFHPGSLRTYLAIPP